MGSDTRLMDGIVMRKNKYIWEDSQRQKMGQLRMISLCLKLRYGNLLTEHFSLSSFILFPPQLVASSMG